MENTKFTNINFLIQYYNNADDSRKVSTKRKRNITKKPCRKESTCHLCNKQFVENELSKPVLLDHIGHKFQLCSQCEMPHKFCIGDSDGGNKAAEIPLNDESRNENFPQKNFFKSIGLKRKVNNEQPSSSSVQNHCSTKGQLRKRKHHHRFSNFETGAIAREKKTGPSTKDPNPLISDTPNRLLLKRKACENVPEIDYINITEETISNHKVHSICELEPCVIDVCNHHIKKACHETFMTENYVNFRNIHPSTSKEPCTCEDCIKPFNLKQSNDEREIIRKIDNLYVCKICSRGFSRLWLLKNHLTVHSWDEQLESEICNKEIIKKPTFNRHLEVHNSRPYACEICQKRFLYYLHLQQHLRCAHNEEKTNNCTVCNSGLFSEKGHICKNSYACYPCNKQFTRKEILDTHNSVHIREEPYHCEICKKRFKQRSNFNKHVLIHSRLNRTNVPNKTHIPVKTNQDIYACPFRSQQFLQKSLLRRHVLGHKKALKIHNATKNGTKDTYRHIKSTKDTDITIKK